IAKPGEKRLLYVSPALSAPLQKQEARRRAKAAQTGTRPGSASTETSASWTDDGGRLVPAGTRKSPATFSLDLFHRPASRATRALVALISGIIVLLAGLAVAVWLAGRWMVAPLARLSAQVDKV